MKGWHLVTAVTIAVIIGYFAGAKFPGFGNRTLAKIGL